MEPQFADEGRGDGEGQEELHRIDGADHAARFDALHEQVRRHYRAPSASAGRIEETADQPQRFDHLRPRGAVPMRRGARQQIDADQHEIAEHERLHHARVDVAQQPGSGHSADQAGHEQPDEQPPVDIAMEQVADSRDGGGEGLDDMDVGRCARRRHAHHRHQQGIADDAERHAQRAVDDLRGEADEDEGQQRVGAGKRKVQTMISRPAAMM